jgi:hypothetical protein
LSSVEAEQELLTVGVRQQLFAIGFGTVIRTPQQDPAMPRHILDEAFLHPAIRERVANHERATVEEVRAAVAAHPVVVVGMRANPYPAKARRLLT